MLFRVKRTGLSSVLSAWNPRELQIESYLLPEASTPILHEDVFKEPLLLVSNQVLTPHKKRADLLALDRLGNAVVIELKRDRGSLGVETQALQYLAEFSGLTGRSFIDRFEAKHPNLEENVRSFTGADVGIEDINRRSRLILMARSFDPAIFSLANWLTNQGVPVRCIEYRPIEIGEERFLDFSVAFDQGPQQLFPLAFSGKVREPEIFWFNIGFAEDPWWGFLVESGQISAGYENRAGDRGEQLLTSFVKGDRIVAYANGYGAIGWATVESPSSYRLLTPDAASGPSGERHLHRLAVKWQCAAKKLKDAITSSEVRESFDVFHPMSTSVRMDARNGELLIRELDRRFGAGEHSHLA